GHDVTSVSAEYARNGAARGAIIDPSRFAGTPGRVLDTQTCPTNRCGPPVSTTLAFARSGRPIENGVRLTRPSYAVSDATAGTEAFRPPGAGGKASLSVDDLPRAGAAIGAAAPPAVASAPGATSVRARQFMSRGRGPGPGARLLRSFVLPRPFSEGM